MYPCLIARRCRFSWSVMYLLDYCILRTWHYYNDDEVSALRGYNSIHLGLKCATETTIPGMEVEVNILVRMLNLPLLMNNIVVVEIQWWVIIDQLLQHNKIPFVNTLLLNYHVNPHAPISSCMYRDRVSSSPVPNFSHLGGVTTRHIERSVFARTRRGDLSTTRLEPAEVQKKSPRVSRRACNNWIKWWPWWPSFAKSRDCRGG